MLKQSPNDFKQYQTITLLNGLRVLLIHNQESDKSAAALAVNTGHFNDPKDRQGLAHFLEHMLFLGTKKFPDGSEYQKFINQFGGSNNAWTATEHTCFFFDIHAEQFEKALDRFCQFFISPLLSDEFVATERVNIEAEFKLKLKDDIRRLYDVHKETINQAHPFSQFSVGDLDTLADRENQNIRDELSAFFETYYCADYMTLAIEGPQTLAVLEKLANQYFSPIKSAKEPIAPINQPLYLPEHQSIQILVKPVKNDHQLIISFAMESIDKYYQSKPESILAYLLGHEGKGSILSLLKQKQWAMSLTAGSGINGSNFKDFNISISLTPLGEANINNIVSIVFSYIELLKSNKIPNHYYEEKQAIAELSFQYHEKSRAIDNVSQLVLNMQHYPPEDYIFGDYIMSGMNDAHINKLLGYLSADNLRITYISQNNNFSQTSFWYQVPYQVDKISPELLEQWRIPTKNNALYLPSKNPYIVGNPHIFKNENIAKQPELLEKNEGITIWYKQDTTFKVPKGYIYVGIDSPFSIANTQNIAMTRLFVDLFTDTVTEENYDAELAGIHYSLYAHQGGVTLQLSGISDKQSDLLSVLLARLQDHESCEQHFELFKQQLIKHWQNADKSKSISQLFSTLSSMMQPNNPNGEALAQSLSKVSFEDYQLFCQNLFNEITIETLIHGNWLLEHAHIIKNTIKDAFQQACHSKNAVKCPVVDISDQHTLIMPITLNEHDHATVIYTPLVDRFDKTIALTMVTSHLLSPLFFQKMRTEKQYGYLVGVGYVPINRYPGIAFYIQSPHTDAVTLSLAIDDFVTHCLAEINEISKDDWQHLIHGLAGQLQENDSSLRIKSQRFWAAICNKDELFAHKLQLVEAILSLTLQDISQFIRQKLRPSADPDRIILLSQQQPSTNKESHVKQLNRLETDLNGQLIDKPADFIHKNKIKY